MSEDLFFFPLLIPYCMQDGSWISGSVTEKALNKVSKDVGSGSSSTTSKLCVSLHKSLNLYGTHYQYAFLLDDHSII